MRERLAESGGMSADLAGFGGGVPLLRRSDNFGEGGRVSSELSESSPDDGMGPP